MIRQFTTPTLAVEVGADLTGCDVWISIKCNGERTDHRFASDEIEVNGDTTTLKVPLTQEETGAYTVGQTIVLQANWITSDGVRRASEQRRITVTPNILDEVISYGDQT